MCRSLSLLDIGKFNSIQPRFFKVQQRLAGRWLGRSILPRCYGDSVQKWIRPPFSTGPSSHSPAKKTWLVVYLPLWKMWKSVGMMTFPIWWESHKIHVPVTTDQLMLYSTFLELGSRSSAGISWRHNILKHVNILIFAMSMSVGISPPKKCQDLWQSPEVSNDLPLIPWHKNFPCSPKVTCPSSHDMVII